MDPRPYLRKFALAGCLTAFFLGCSKDYSYEGGVPPAFPDPPIPEEEIPEPTKEERLLALLAESRFMLTAFYADRPIDYITNDAEVKSETDLWVYVVNYLKDDVFSFSDDGGVAVIQHTVKIPGNTDPELQRAYSTGTDEEGTYFVFLDYQYNPFTYQLHEVGDDYFILSVEWDQGEALLFSRYEQVP